MIKAFFWAWVIVAVTLDVGDIVTTYLILSRGGVELNKSASFVFREIGLIPGLVVWSVIKAILITVVGSAFLYLNKHDTWQKHGPLVAGFGLGMIVLLATFLVAIKTFALLLNYTALI